MRKATMGWAPWSAQSIPCGVEEPVHAEKFSDRNLGGPGVVPRVCRYARARSEGVSSAGATLRAAGKSDRGIVPMKQTNKVADPAAESAEGRPLTKRNSRKHVDGRTQNRSPTTSRLAAVHEAARANRHRVAVLSGGSMSLGSMTLTPLIADPIDCSDLDGIWWDQNAFANPASLRMPFAVCRDLILTGTVNGRSTCGETHTSWSPRPWRSR